MPKGKRQIVKIYCLCRKPEDNRFMIECGECWEWFHGSCVGILKTSKHLLQDVEWFCPSCCTEKFHSMAMKLSDTSIEVAKLQQERSRLLDSLTKMQEDKLVLLQNEVQHLTTRLNPLELTQQHSSMALTEKPESPINNEGIEGKFTETHERGFSSFTSTQPETSNHKNPVLIEAQVVSLERKASSTKDQHRVRGPSRLSLQYRKK